MPKRPLIDAGMRIEPAAVAADRHRSDARRHRRTRTRARAAGGARGIPRVVGRREDQVVAGTAVAEFRNIGLADDDGTRRLQALDHDIVFGRNKILVDDRSRCGPDALRVDQILDPDRDARQRTDRPAGHDVGLDRLRLLPRHIGCGRAEGAEDRVELLHPGEHRLGHLGRRQFFAADLCGQGHRVHAADLVRRCGNSGRRCERTADGDGGAGRDHEFAPRHSVFIAGFCRHRLPPSASDLWLPSIAW